MLKRIITALLLAPIVMAITLAAPSIWFVLLLVLIACLGLIEWCLLVQVSVVYTVFSVILLVTIVVLYLVIKKPMFGWVALSATVYWVWQLVDMWRHQLGSHLPAWRSRAEGVFVLSVCVLSLISLYQNQEHGKSLACTLLLLIWAADIGAYFCGKYLGKTKLVVEISPGKTVEGLIGGLCGTLLLALITSFVYFKFEGVQLVGWLLASVFAALFSVVGDLSESRLKRFAGVKNSSALLPGHGGILDRIDSLIAAAPIFVIVLIGFGVHT